jgi:hypothetical protein
MKILGYGEDALTLWALQNRLIQILEFLDDPSGSFGCKIFFRPSFGRRGGSGSSQFGEFDFILLTRTCIYLGESKWDKSPEFSDTGLLELRPEQLLRHQVFAFYVREWAFGQYDSWDRFVLEGTQKLLGEGINKRLAPAGSLLALNLKQVLGIIRRHFPKEPKIVDLLLYLYNGSKKKAPPSMTDGRFRLVPVDYSSVAEGNFVPIEI